MLYQPSTGVYRALKPSRLLDPISLYTADTGLLSTTIGPLTLSAGYQGAVRLKHSDATALSQAVADAYTELSNLASAAGAFVQPVLARYRLLDASGATVYVSAPVLISYRGSGPQHTNETIMLMSADDKGRSVLSEASASIGCYHLSAFIPRSLADDWSNYAHSYVIEVSPQLDPLDLSRLAPYTLNGRSEQPRRLSAHFPGADCASQLFGHILPGAVDNFGRHCRTLVSGLLADIPADGLTISDISFHDPVNPAARHALALDLARSSGVDASDMAALSLPHSLTSAEHIVSGHAMLWPAPGYMPFSGYRASHYAVSRPSALSSLHRMAVTVDFASGESCLQSYEMTSGSASLMLSAMLMYPHPDAQRISFRFMVDGVSRAAHFNLTPSPDRSCALYVNPGFTDIDLIAASAPQTFIVPAPSVSEHSLPTSFALSASSDPLTFTDVSPHGASHIIRAADSPGVNSLVDTPRFVLFTTDGVQRVAVAQSGGRFVLRGIRRIDSREIVSREAVCSDGFSLYALLGGDLVRFNGSRVHTLVRGVCRCNDAASLGYSPRGEVWISLPGYLWVYSPPGKTFFRRRNPGASPGQQIYDSMINEGGNLVASDIASGNIAMLSDEIDADVDVDYRCVLPHAPRGRPQIPHILALDVRASRCNASCNASAFVGVGPAELLMTQDRNASAKPLASVAISGHVRAPVSCPVVAPPSSALRVAFTGSLNSGARLLDINVI